MEDLTKNIQLRHVLNRSIEDLQGNGAMSAERLLNFFCNSSKKKGLISNRIRDGAFCVNQMNHEIKANNILVTELQENAKEEEKKLAEYPKLMNEIDEQINEIMKNIELCKQEKKALKPQTCIIKKEWEEKLNALIDVLGFNTDANVHNILMQYKNDTDTSCNHKESVNLLLKEGSYEINDTSTQVESFENHIRKLNRGMPFSSFCYELKKTVEDTE